MSARSLFRFAAAALVLIHGATYAQETSYCSLPGQIIVEGSRGTGGIPINSPVPGHTIEAIYGAEPASLPGQLAITMKVDTLSPPPSSTVYQVNFSLDDGQTYYVAYEPEAAAGTQFTYGQSFGSYSSQTQLGLADMESNVQTDGTITWALNHDLIDGLRSSGTASDIFGEIKIRTLPADSENNIQNDVALTDKGRYRLRGSDSCGGVSKSTSVSAFSGALPPWLLAPLALGVGLRRRMKANKPCCSAY